jgi:hypothetical protein
VLAGQAPGRRRFLEFEMSSANVSASVGSQPAKVSWFGSRGESISQLGFASYSHYLASELWAFVRQSLGDSKQCQICKSTTGLAWHHRSYSINVLVGNFSSDETPIVRLCKECHKLIHQKDGKWIDDCEQVDQRFVLLSDNFFACEGSRKAAVACHSVDWSQYSSFADA